MAERGTISYRAARPSDAEAVAAVQVAAMAEMTYLPVLHTPEEVAAYFAVQVLPSCEVTVAEAGGEVVGFAAVGEGWLRHLYVRPDRQRRGAGSSLLDRAMVAHPAGLSLWVFEENDRAQALYRRAGFVERRRTDGSGNEEQVPDIEMRWPGIRD